MRLNFFAKLAIFRETAKKCLKQVFNNYRLK